MHNRRRGRPICPRRIGKTPEERYFKPRGVPLQDAQVVSITFEELEAMRLVDYLDYEQEEAAAKMNVSRRTLARELHSARKKIADALVNGKVLEVRESGK